MPSKYLCIFVSVWEGVGVGVGVVAAWRRGWIIEWDPKFPHVSLLVGWSGGPPLGKFWKPRMQEKPSQDIWQCYQSLKFTWIVPICRYFRRKFPFIPCFLNVFEAGRTSSVGCAYRLVSRRSRVDLHARHILSRRFAWSWKKIYDHCLPSADSRRAVVSYWRKNVH